MTKKTNMAATTKNRLEHYEYNVNGREGYSLTMALRLWKAKFETLKHFQRDVITHPGLEELGNFVSEMWDNIKPVTVEEALSLNNVEERRLYFDCIGVAKLFQSMDPKLLDKQTVKKKRVRWNEDNKEWEHNFEDIYELYSIEGTKIFGKPKDDIGRPFLPVYAVRCWCTTTAREYWIYVPEEIAIGSSRNFRNEFEQNIPDAIRAIAWTIRIDITNPKRILRQGDIILVEESDDSQQLRQPKHLDSKEYLSLMYSET